MIIDAVAFEFLALKCECSFAGCSQINRRIIFVCYDFSENSADLETGRILTGRSVVTFDSFVNTFESANFERHLAGKFFRYIFEMLKIAADKKLRLFRGDIERAILSVDRVGDFLYLQLQTRDRFADR